MFFVRNERIIQDGLQYYNASKLRSFSILKFILWKSPKHDRHSTERQSLSVLQP
jgi:hypothetical protein